MRRTRAGFTLIELMIVVAIITILTAIAVVTYSNTVRKSEDGVTKGNLATLRSALAIYYTDNDGSYPTDNLTSLTSNNHYLISVPIAHVMPAHNESMRITAESVPSDTGGWSFDNASSDTSWGALRVGCLHQDMLGQSWTSY